MNKFFTKFLDQFDNFELNIVQLQKDYTLKHVIFNYVMERENDMN